MTLALGDVVHVVLPDGVDDPQRPSGGNVYDRRVCSGLTRLGWSVHEHQVPGSWPTPEPPASTCFRTAIASIPDDATVLIDGLIASASPEILVPASARLRLVVLVHLPLGHDARDAPAGEAGPARSRECQVLTSVHAVVTTSAWTRRWLLRTYPLDPDSVIVAEPGVDAAAAARSSLDGSRLLCVAAVTPGKGHEVLVEALAHIQDLPWRCVCVGSLTKDPRWVAQLAALALDLGVAGRLTFTGPLSGSDLEAAYAGADLLVLPSRAETYGMVIAEALARGVPVVSTTGGGQAEALGHGADQTLPGALVTPGDPAALATSLRSWLSEDELRERLRRAALERRETLRAWPDTAADLARILAGVAS